MKNILFIGGTHGNEPIGVRALKKLETRIEGFDWIIGNPPALEAKTREFEGDLNRSAPGDRSSTQFTKRRAAEIVELSQSYRWTIDIHGTNAFTGIFVIITNPKQENLELALRLHIPRIVIWPSFSEELTGPLSGYVRCGIEIECGPKDMPRVQKRLAEILEDFVQRSNGNQNEDLASRIPQTTVYEVYGSLRNADTTGFEEFVETNINGECFFPLLIGRYQERNGIACYKMRKNKEALSCLMPTSSSAVFSLPTSTT
ncbi:MAG TPA: succinylglutamate desuccinylase/aspartoacylase family protein [Patescibacteria group bacterium]|nr:succinylglutamate desuccinylase/aspartoacylase family protein [Patescibacteria group bacterium]